MDQNGPGPNGPKKYKTFLEKDLLTYHDYDIICL